VAKNKTASPSSVRGRGLDDPRDDTPDLLPPAGTTDQTSVATGTGKAADREIKEWQAIMDTSAACGQEGPTARDSGG